MVLANFEHVELWHIHLSFQAQYLVRVGRAAREFVWHAQGIVRLRCCHCPY